jgi:hypothetical protein
MQDANTFRKLVTQCRALEKTAIEPEVIEQLRVWAVELAEEAEGAGRRASAHEEAGPAVSGLREAE